MKGIKPDTSSTDRFGHPGTFPIDKRYFLIPRAGLVVTLPKARNALIFHKIKTLE